MRNYEIMFIVRPNLEVAEIKKVAEDYKVLVLSTQAQNVELKEMGQKELAYEVKKFKTGYYFLLTFKTDNVKDIKEFDRVATISENIIRHLIVKDEK